MCLAISLYTYPQYKDIGNRVEAVKSYETAIALKRDHFSAWNNLALFYEDSSM